MVTLPEIGSKWRDSREIVTITHTRWNSITFKRQNGEQGVLPGALFKKRFMLVENAPRPAVSLDHPLIERFLALRGRQITA